MAKEDEVGGSKGWKDCLGPCLGGACSVEQKLGWEFLRGRGRAIGRSIMIGLNEWEVPRSGNQWEVVTDRVTGDRAPLPQPLLEDMWLRMSPTGGLASSHVATMIPISRMTVQTTSAPKPRMGHNELTHQQLFGEVKEEIDLKEGVTDSLCRVTLCKKTL